MSVNEKIRLIREAKGLTQEQIAEKLNISPSTYGDIERGDNDPKLSKLQKIADILEMPLSELLELGEKGTVNINFTKQGKHYNVYFAPSTYAELEKQQLLNELKDKEIAMQQREIEYLKQINTLLQKENA